MDLNINPGAQTRSNQPVFPQGGVVVNGKSAVCDHEAQVRNKFVKNQGQNIPEALKADALTAAHFQSNSHSIALTCPPLWKELSSNIVDAQRASHVKITTSLWNFQKSFLKEASFAGVAINPITNAEQYNPMRNVSENVTVLIFGTATLTDNLSPLPVNYADQLFWIEPFNKGSAGSGFEANGWGLPKQHRGGPKCVPDVIPLNGAEVDLIKRAYEDVKKANNVFSSKDVIDEIKTKQGTDASGSVALAVRSIVENCGTNPTDWFKKRRIGMATCSSQIRHPINFLVQY